MPVHEYLLTFDHPRSADDGLAALLRLPVVVKTIDPMRRTIGILSTPETYRNRVRRLPGLVE